MQIPDKDQRPTENQADDFLYTSLTLQHLQISEFVEVLILTKLKCAFNEQTLMS